VNDSTSYSWKKAGIAWLKPKSKGKGIIISEFLCATHRRLHYLDNSSGSPKVVYTTEVIKYSSGTSDDG
jgi:hypothetical protein